MSNKLIKNTPKRKEKRQVVKKSLSAVCILMYTIAFLIMLVCSIMIGLCRWASSTFNVGLNAIINTMLSSLSGASSTTVLPAVRACVPWVMVTIVITVMVICYDRRRKKRGSLAAFYLLFSVFYIFCSFCYVQKKYDIVHYFRDRNKETSLYADRYIDPRLVKIKPEGKKRNLIYLYLESMENTYADTENGGSQEVNYIPYLTGLAKDHFSFSYTEKGLGGFRMTDGAGWTMGALFATTTGIPFEFPVGNNAMSEQEEFASGVYSMGDFLEDQGYRQIFLCGSDGAFAGREKYMLQHGGYEIYDYKQAKKSGDIPAGYKVFWGFEDAKLYEIAKKKALELAESEQPFNLTILTVDTHHIGGYKCQLCEETYEKETANIVRCADRQAEDFIEWLKQQDFYEDTTVVITGDHPRMDNCLMENVVNDRLVYNCYLNTAYDGKVVNVNRDSTGMDVFPTTLAAMGYEIEGDRLGLGTNLFSDRQTLVEEYGMEALNRELVKTSRYYIEYFAPELFYLVEDVFGALKTVYFYGGEYNADQYVTSAVMPAGVGAWVVGEQMDVDIPIETEQNEVSVNLHIHQTLEEKKQFVQLCQEGEYGEIIMVPGNCVINMTVKVKDGHCKFSLMLPNAVSAHDMDESNPDTTKLSILLKSITVNECEK